MKRGLLLWWCFYAALAQAHTASDSFLYIDSDSLRLDLALRDLYVLHPFDLDGDGHLRWNELESAQGEFARLIRQGVTLQKAGQEQGCPTAVALLGLTEHSSGPYGSWAISSPCLGSPGVTLHYNLLFDTDPLHRALYRFSIMPGADANIARLGVLSPTDQQLDLSGMAGRWQTARDFFHQGIVHLVLGFDHLLFLLVLVLPVLRRRAAALTWRRDALELAAIVTMFTLAHSVTLALATLGWLTLPSAPVEIAIALSIVVAAVVALLPLRPLQRQLAFGFGLLHGLGFAGVLADLVAGQSSLLLALFSFNLGVEVAQLALVLLALAVLLPLRQQPFFQRALAPTGLLLAGGMGLVWAGLRLQQWLA